MDESAVAVDLAAFGATVDDDVSLFGVWLDANGLHSAAAGVGAVAGIDVHVKRPEAERAVVARGVAEGLYLKSAVGADKAVIVFCKKLLFHIFSF